jgi:aldose 1-epimerase
MSKSTNPAQVFEEQWQNEPVLRFRAGGYEAAMVPGVGAQIIALNDLTRGLDLLRRPNPDDLAGFKARPQIYGIPVLFPPNRIEDGKFPIGARTVQFPITSPTGNNHLHGFLRIRPWKVTRTVAQGEMVTIEAVFESDRVEDDYEQYLKQFLFKMRYTLSGAGLEQRLSITNRGKEALPVGVGFHTAFKVPFHPQSDPRDYRLKVSVDQKWELNERILPTGNLLPLTPAEQAYRSEGVLPQGTPVSDHFTAAAIEINGKPFHGAIIEDICKGLRLVYRVGKTYKHWMIWNDNGNQGFVCPEPQSWVINAPHVRMAPEITGYMELLPGETWEEECAIYVEAF